jgi:hypothetical protein
VASSSLNIGGYLFLDFEKDTKENFYLAGYQNAGGFQQVILTPRLLGLAKELKLQLIRPEDFAREFLEGARTHQHTVVAYSIAEQDILMSLLPEEQALLRSVQYLNLLKAARSWIRKYKREEFEALPPLVKSANEYSKKRHPKSLASICRLIGFDAPADYAIGKTTSRFNTVISALEKRDQHYPSLTAVQKAKATKAIKHNRYDVEAMVELLNVIQKTDPNIVKRATSSLLRTDSKEK